MGQSIYGRQQEFVNFGAGRRTMIDPVGDIAIKTAAYNFRLALGNWRESLQV